MAGAFKAAGKDLAGMGKKKSKGKAGGFVLDCSLTVSWFFEDETDAYAWPGRTSFPFMMPAIWRLPCGVAYLWPPLMTN
jgi:hypothetical protein